MKHLVEMNPKINLLFLGNGKLESFYKSKVRKIGLQKNIKFLGLQKNMPEFYSIFDLFVLPSLFEGVPLTLIESQASGLNCFISNEINDDADMGLNLLQKLKINSASLWAEKIYNFLSSRPKEIKRENKSEICVAKIKEKGFDIIETTRRIEEIYNSFKC